MNDEARSGRLSPWAVAALVVGLIGVGVAASPFLLPIVPSIIAILLAGKARRDIQRSRGELRGLALARAGQLLGWLGIGVRIYIATVIELDRAWLFAMVIPIAVILAIVFWSARRAESRR